MKVYESAKKIIERLRSSGYIAYFAGGWVRDYLMGHPSEDIDIATNAPPEKIVQLFNRTIPVGISFGVVIVVCDGHHFEVSTFRKDFDYQDGRRPNQIALSTPQEDAERRDFTINGMFFDPIEEKVIDYVHGRDDIKNKILKTIGDPQERFREDRLRLIRAVRFAHRFGFHIEENTRLAIKQNAKTLFPAVAIERVWQELKKMADYPRFGSALLELHNLGLLEIIFPELSGVSSDEVKKRVQGFEKFPDEAPAILFLMELFPSHNIDGLTAICQYLKVSNKDQKIVEVTNLIRARLKESCDDAEWAKLYAHPSCELVFHVIAARLGEVEGKDLLSEYQNKKMKLKHHIDRIKARSPLVGSEDLIKEGIAPGKNMGLLLQEAERQSINSDVNDKTELMKILKKSDFWPR